MLELSPDELSKLTKKQLIEIIKNNTSEQKNEGLTKKLLSKQELFENIMQDLQNKTESAVPGELIISELVKTGRFTNLQARSYLDKMYTAGRVFQPKLGYFQLV